MVRYLHQESYRRLLINALYIATVDQEIGKEAGEVRVIHAI